MTDPILQLLTGGPTTSDAMREKIAALYRLLPVRRDPVDSDELMVVLRVLYRVARADLPLARLFEGHVDALQIISRYAMPDFAGRAFDIAARGGAFGVWNAALPGEPLRVEDGRLSGGKSYASGAGILTHALSAADTAEGNRLVLIDLDGSAPQIDHDWWRVIGMQRSQTQVVRWDRVAPDSFDYVGSPGDYEREPFFSGGAVRFVACHAGGIAAVFDHVRSHLGATGRTTDPHQAGRLADLYILAESASAWVRMAAASWGASACVDRVAAARVAVGGFAEQALAIAQQAVGVSGMFVSHPLSAALTDLMVYLRQPAPDAQRMRVAKAVAEAALGSEL